ncbi:MAG: AAA family ATPase [Deltaproteobacteria bacterium]|nr:AAA family ATPase [Deltaproteobacteria bacterium]
MAINELQPQDLRIECTPDSLGFRTTEELEPLDDFVGQERAIRALRVGLGIDREGYNLFVAGSPGTGRVSLTMRHVEQAAKGRPAPEDLCYVHDFGDPHHPIPLRLPAGQGPRFAADVDRLVRGPAAERPARFEVLVRRWGSHPRVPEVVARLHDAVQEPGQTPAFLGVNVLVTSDPDSTAPVVIETNPTLRNLFGRIERRVEMGAMVTDVGLIRPGSLHRAHGGYLVISGGADLARRSDAYEALKRALRARTISIEEPEADGHPLVSGGLRPLPAPLDVKVIVIGTTGLYYQLLASDEDFPEIFKVKVEVDDRMDRTATTVAQLGRFVAGVCRREGLVPVDASGVARLVDFASETVDDRTKLSTRFAELADVVRESELWARGDGAPTVGAASVDRAIEERRHRVDLYEDRVQEWMTRGTIAIDLRGEVVGQVNGLSVIDLGDHVFARPARITASLGPGREGVLDIEREAELGGPLHTKGMLILQGYLQQLLGWDEPVALRASLCFEQSYGPVDGDSASVAELCVILSALAEVPIRQPIAITGALSQRGDVQAIGDVSCKVEGYFRACHAAGELDGKQGVVIPAANREHLLLSRELCDVVAEGKFHVWTVERVEEALALLTGGVVGEPSPDGFHPRDSILAKAQRRLRLFADRLSRMKE